MYGKLCKVLNDKHSFEYSLVTTPHRQAYLVPKQHCIHCIPASLYYQTVQTSKLQHFITLTCMIHFGFSAHRVHTWLTAKSDTYPNTRWLSFAYWHYLYPHQWVSAWRQCLDTCSHSRLNSEHTETPPLCVDSEVGLSFNSSKVSSWLCGENMSLNISINLKAICKHYLIFSHCS